MSRFRQLAPGAVVLGAGGTVAGCGWALGAGGSSLGMYRGPIWPQPASSGRARARLNIASISRISGFHSAKRAIIPLARSRGHHNGTTMVFSRQPPTRQLWLAARAGGFHFAWNEQAGDWCDTRDGKSFRPFVVEQMREQAGIDFAWG